MLYNLHSSLPDPLKKVIPLNDEIYVPKLTTIVHFDEKTRYIHVYKKCRDCYRYQKTFSTVFS